MVYSILHVRRYPWLDKQLCIQWFDWQISFPMALMVSKENASASDYSLATLSHCCVCKDSDFVQSWAYHMKPWNNFPGNWKLDSFPLCQSFLKQIFTRGCAQYIVTLPFAVSVFWVLAWPSLCWCFSGYSCELEQQIQGGEKTQMNTGYFLQKRGRKWFICFNLNTLYLFHHVPSRWFFFLYSLSLITIKILFYPSHDSLETVIADILKDSSLESWTVIRNLIPYTAKKKKNLLCNKIVHKH